MQIDQKYTSINELYSYYIKSTGVTTDSRKVNAGSIYISLKGDRFDGNEYAQKALDNGAKYAVVDQADKVLDQRFLLVEDGLKTLQKLATFHRRQFTIPVIAITGSNGKTTTKELAASILSSYYETHFTQGNLNNHIGVPLTLLEMETNVNIAIIEMGANHLEEIKALCEIAEPSHGLITNVGLAHLEGFGNLDGVKKGKGELYDFLTQNKGIAFVNMNENHLEEMMPDKLRKVFYTESKQPDPNFAPYEIKQLESPDFLKIEFLIGTDTFIAQSNLIGNYNFNNLMTAVALGKYFKVPGQKIKEGIENYVPSNNRSQIIEKDSNTIILDAYNANPSSMKSAIDNLLEMDATNKVVIIGDMLEMGAVSTKEHQRIIDYLVDCNFKEVCLVGEEFGKTDRQTFHHFENVDAASNWFQQQSFSNSTILIKGSRGIRLEEILG